MIYAQFFVHRLAARPRARCRNGCRGRTRGLRRLELEQRRQQLRRRLGEHQARLRHDRRLAGGTVRHRDAGHGIPQLDRRPGQAVRECVPRLQGQHHPAAGEQRPVLGQAAGGLHLRAGARRDADLLGRLHDALHPLPARAEQVRGRELGDVRLDLELGSVLRRPRLPGRQRQDLRRADRLRLLRAVLQQVDAHEGGRLDAAHDVRRAARRVRQAEGVRRHPDRLRRP